jgi:hypothetical protein
VHGECSCEAPSDRVVRGCLSLPVPRRRLLSAFSRACFALALPPLISPICMWRYQLSPRRCLQWCQACLTPAAVVTLLAEPRGIPELAARARARVGQVEVCSGRGAVAIRCALASDTCCSAFRHTRAGRLCVSCRVQFPRLSFLTPDRTLRSAMPLKTAASRQPLYGTCAHRRRGFQKPLRCGRRRLREPRRRLALSLAPSRVLWQALRQGPCVLLMRSECLLRIRTPPTLSQHTSPCSQHARLLSPSLCPATADR